MLTISVKLDAICPWPSPEKSCYNRASKFLSQDRLLDLSIFDSEVRRWTKRSGEHVIQLETKTTSQKYLQYLPYQPTIVWTVAILLSSCPFLAKIWTVQFNCKGGKVQWCQKVPNEETDPPRSSVQQVFFCVERMRTYLRKLSFGFWTTFSVAEVGRH